MSILKSAGSLKIAAIAGVLLLSACDETSNVTPGFTRGEIVESTLIFANSKGPVPVEIYGDPFGMRDSVLAEKFWARLMAISPRRSFALPPIKTKPSRQMSVIALPLAGRKKPDRKNFAAKIFRTSPPISRKSPSPVPFAWTTNASRMSKAGSAA